MSEFGAAANLPSEGITVSDSTPFHGNTSGDSSGNYTSLPNFNLDLEPNLVKKDEKYKCPVHGGLLREPIQTSCGHRLCKDCLEVYLGTAESKPCPFKEADCEEVRRDNIFPDPGFKREIKQCLVYCSFKSCDVTVKLGLLEKHLAECEFREVACKFASRGCKEVLVFKALEAHQNGCGFRPISCAECGSGINAADKEDHEKKFCPETAVRCKFKCGLKLKRKQLEDHLQICPKKPSECSYKSLGCKFQGDKEVVREHEKDTNAHFEVLIQFTVTAEEQRREAKQEVEELKAAGEEMKRKIEAVTADLTNIHRELRLKMMQQVERVLQLEQKTEELSNNLRDMPQLQHMNQSIEQLKTLIPQVANQDRLVASHEIRMAEVDLRFQMLETASYDGKLLWKIRDFSHRKRDAVQGRTVSLYSQPFYAGRFGYKMCARVYLNGDGIGRGTHMSLYFVVMKGEYDALLPWPFQHRVSLMLLDQSPAKRHLKDEFFPDPNSTSFRRPDNSEMNVASGCPLFVAHTVLDNATNEYVKDDTLFIKVVSLILLDQSPAKRHLKDEFFPDPNSTSFRRPDNSEMNVASGCPLFVAHTVLDNASNEYVKDDTLFIKVVVDTSDLQPLYSTGLAVA